MGSENQAERVIAAVDLRQFLTEAFRSYVEQNSDRLQEADAAELARVAVEALRRGGRRWSL